MDFGADSGQHVIILRGQTALKMSKYGTVIVLAMCISYALATELVNIALMKPTEQLGNLKWPTQAETWHSETAVDGVYNCPSNVSNTYYSGTNDSLNPWWKVDLEDIYPIHEVRVIGRTGEKSQLAGFELFFSKNGTFPNSWVYKNTLAGYNNGNITISNLNVHARHMKIILSNEFRENNGTSNKPGSLVLCEVQVFVKAINVATGKLVNTSLLYKKDSKSDMVDGNRNQDENRCNCCGIVDNGASPWITVDLGEQVWIMYIRLYGRLDSEKQRDSLQNIVVSVDNTRISNRSNFTRESNLVDISPKPLHGRFLQITASQPMFLVVCELEVFVKECDNGTYGNCSTECHCLNNVSCDPVYGSCPNNQCASGWHGLACNNTCPNGTFGNNCSAKCHCLDNVTCDFVVGTCPEDKCAPGWLESNCSTACPNGTFGNNCSAKCHCLDNVTCDFVVGTCPEDKCAPGWLEPNCSTACPNGTFGNKCVAKCHCLDNVTCDFLVGTCPKNKCAPGWLESNCSTAIPLAASKSADTGSIAGGVVAAIIIVIAISVAAGLIIRKRKQYTSAKANNLEFSNIGILPNKHTHRKPNCSREYANKNPECKDDDVNREGNADNENTYYRYSDDKQTGVQIHELWDYIKKMSENKENGFHEEFQNLPKGLVFNHETAMQDDNAGKNRYKEMYAYDHSRVVLKKDTEDETDYINASYINGFGKEKKYIASQGPTKQMIQDFWRMVWQEKSNRIVMLTNLVELGVQKCMQYWPEEDKGQCSFGNIDIELLKTDTYPDYDIRHLKVVKLKGTTRELIQYQFKSWPDKDVPDSTWCLVNFWRAVENDAKSTLGPIVVHCSAGVGRTGTYIALDILVNQARLQGFVQPLEVVENLRQQRVNMVQTVGQYVYLHEAVADAMLFGTHFVWSGQFKHVYKFMTGTDSESSKTRIELQYNLIVKSTDAAFESSANESIYANVQSNKAEKFAYQPNVRTGEHKILLAFGATVLHNYMNKSSYIVAKSPSEKTLEQFWNLVMENNIKTIIMLTESSTSNYKEGCSFEDRSNNSVGKYYVSIIAERKSRYFTETVYAVSEQVAKDNESKNTVKQFRCTNWKDSSITPDDTQSILALLEEVDKWQPHITDVHPILLHCRTGCQRSGLVCVIMNEIYRMKREGGQINIVDTVKRMKYRNMDIINNFEQYRYCYDAILTHVKQLDVYQNI